MSRFDEEIVRAGEDGGVALDAALGVEEEVVGAFAGLRCWMELVTMPLSQRTRSSPVTRIQPVLSERRQASPLRSAAEL